MTTWTERMTPRPPEEPPLQLVRTLFRMRGASRRPLRCAVYQVATGHELRLEYEDREDLVRSQLFPVPDDDAIAALAGEWRQALRDKGFTEVKDEVPS